MGTCHSETVSVTPICSGGILWEHRDGKERSVSSWTGIMLPAGQGVVSAVPRGRQSTADADRSRRSGDSGGRPTRKRRTGRDKLRADRHPPTASAPARTLRACHALRTTARGPQGSIRESASLYVGQGSQTLHFLFVWQAAPIVLGRPMAGCSSRSLAGRISGDDRCDGKNRRQEG